MKKYKHIFFDLDHTLWDLERNSAETIVELFSEYKLQEKLKAPVPEFITKYNKINDALWEQYRKGEIDRKTLRLERFRKLFLVFGLDDTKLAFDFGEAFVTLAPNKPHLVEGAKEILDYLAENYILHIITNGFPEAQTTKMQCAGITHYFTHIITSERVGWHKPDIRIFEFSLNLTGASKAESIMIGDHLEADVLGARNAGIDQIYYNPSGIRHQETISHEIRHLKELMKIL